MAFPQRYRPQYGAAPPISPGVLTPFEDDVPQAFDPQAQAEDFQTPSSLAPPPDAIPKPPQDDDTQTAASLSKLPPLAPAADPSASGMRKMGGGMPAPAAPAPAVSPTPEAATPAATPASAPPMAPQAPPAAVAAKPQSDTEKKISALEDKSQALHDKFDSGPKSNWAQRLGLAVLSMTRFAPAANQIIHPKWSEQARGYQRSLGDIQQQEKELETAASTEAQVESREAQAAYRRAQSEQQGVLADSRRQLADPHHGKQQVNEQWAKENLPQLKPDAKGEYWVDSAVANNITKPEKQQPRNIQHFTDDEGLMWKFDEDGEAKPVLVNGKQLKGKPETATTPKLDDKETFMQTYLKDNGMQDNAANRAKGLQAYARASQAPERPSADTATLDRESLRYAKPHEKTVADASSQLEKIADARSMINGSAEAQALGIPKVLTALVSGQGSGVRITQPELNAIAKARGIGGDVQGFLNSISGKGKLTADQQKQLSDLLDSVKERITKKQAIAAAARDGINSAPNKEEMLRIDREANQQLLDLEGGGSGVGGAVPAVGGSFNGHKVLKVEKVQ